MIILEISSMAVGEVSDNSVVDTLEGPFQCVLVDKFPGNEMVVSQGWFRDNNVYFFTPPTAGQSGIWSVAFDVERADIYTCEQ